MLGRLDRALEQVSRALMALAVLAVGAMMLHVVVSVIKRALFAPYRPPLLYTAIESTDEMVAGYYMIAVAFLPIAFLGRRDDHLTADFLADRLGHTARHVLRVFVLALFVAYVTVFTWQAWAGAVKSMPRGNGRGDGVLVTPDFYLATWPGRYLIFVGGVVLLACLVHQLVRQLKPDAPDEHHHSRIPDA